MSPGRGWAGLAAITSLACVLAMSVVATPAGGDGYPVPAGPHVRSDTAGARTWCGCSSTVCRRSHRTYAILPDGSSIVALGGISALGFGDCRHGLAKFDR